MSEMIYKDIGETPLEALDRFRIDKIHSKDLCENGYSWLDIPITYAGRLDPMAEGQLLILIGSECKDKENYLGLDKEYRVDIVFGISTDSYDALGMVKHIQKKAVDPFPITLSEYIGKFRQEYPPYSSKTVNGKQLHDLARNGLLPNEMPTKDVEIFSITVLKESVIGARDLLSQITENINKVKGDFRQKEISIRWNEVLSKSNIDFPIIRIKVICSSGTYMRSLAHRIGGELGCGAFALGIKRTSIMKPQTN